MIPTRSVLLISMIFFAIIVMAVSGCRGKGNEDSRVLQSEKVTICVGGAPGIPAWLAQEKGLFSKRGLDVEIKQNPAGPIGFDKMLAGECDMALTSETAVVLNSFKRQDFSILAALATSEDSPRIVADRKSGIQNPRDLKGKRILVYKGSANHYFLDMFLIKNGLSAKDVKVIFASVSDVAEAFRKREIDAFCASEVLVNKPLKTLGNDAVVFNSPGLCYVFFHISAMNSVIKSRPEAVKKVLAALLENEEFVKKEPGRAIKSASKLLNIDEPAMAEIWNNYNWSVLLSQPLLLSLEHEAQWAVQTGLTSKSAIPNYLDFMHADALRSLNPQAVTMVR